MYEAKLFIWSSTTHHWMDNLEWFLKMIIPDLDSKYDLPFIWNILGCKLGSIQDLRRKSLRPSVFDIMKKINEGVRMKMRKHLQIAEIPSGASFRFLKLWWDNDFLGGFTRDCHSHTMYIRWNVYNMNIRKNRSYGRVVVTVLARWFCVIFRHTIEISKELFHVNSVGIFSLNKVATIWCTSYYGEYSERLGEKMTRSLFIWVHRYLQEYQFLTYRNVTRLFAFSRFILLCPTATPSCHWITSVIIHRCPTRRTFVHVYLISDISTLHQYVEVSTNGRVLTCEPFFCWSHSLLTEIAFIVNANDRPKWDDWMTLISDAVTIRMILANLGKMASMFQYNCLLVHISECFPTKVRSLALGTSAMSSRIGAMTAPFLKQVVSTFDYSIMWTH